MYQCADVSDEHGDVVKDGEANDGIYVLARERIAVGVIGTL